jgi:hypothetical protein
LNLIPEEQQKIELFKPFFQLFKKSFDSIYKKFVDKESKKSKFAKMFKNDSVEMKFLTYFNQYFNINKKTFLNKEYPLFQQMKGGAAFKEESMLSYYIIIFTNKHHN